MKVAKTVTIDAPARKRMASDSPSDREAAKPIIRTPKIPSIATPTAPRRFRP